MRAGAPRLLHPSLAGMQPAHRGCACRGPPPPPTPGHRHTPCSQGRGARRGPERPGAAAAGGLRGKRGRGDTRGQARAWAQAGGGWKGREWIPGASSWPRDPASGSPRLRSFTCVGGRDMGYARSLRGRRVARTTHTYDVRRGYSCAGANRTPRGVHKTTHLRARTHTHTHLCTHTQAWPFTPFALAF